MAPAFLAFYKKMNRLICILLLTGSFSIAKAQLNSADTKSTTLKNLPNGTLSDQGDKVPERVKLMFDKTYPRNIAAWSIESNHYMAEYKDTLRAGHIVTYDQYGNELSKQQELGRDAFPAPIDEYITTNYPNQNFPVWQIMNSDGTSLYYFTRSPETIWFDTTGKFRNKTKNKER